MFVGHSRRPIFVIITRVSGSLSSGSGRSGATEPPQILPATLAMHAPPHPGRDPVCDFRAGPDPAIWRWMLERLAELVLLFRREDWRRAWAALPSIHQPGRPRLAVALGDLADGAWAAARRGLNLGQRRPVGQEADHLPAPAFSCRGSRLAARRDLRAAHGHLLTGFLRRSPTRTSYAKRRCGGMMSPITSRHMCTHNLSRLCVYSTPFGAGCHSTALCFSSVHGCASHRTRLGKVAEWRSSRSAEPWEHIGHTTSASMRSASRC
jgi:hypothetical protein